MPIQQTSITKDTNLLYLSVYLLTVKFIDELEDCHANLTTNLMSVPHQLRRVKLRAKKKLV